MEVYVFEIEVSTHDDLKRGVTAVPRWTGSRWETMSYVFVPADQVTSDHDAWMTAWQLAAASTGMMPTRVDMISFPIGDRRGRTGS